MNEKDNNDGDNLIINNEKIENFLYMNNESLLNNLLKYKNEDNNIINENQKENDYLQLLTKELQNYKKQTIEFLSDSIKKVEEKYDVYINKLIDSIGSLETKMKDILFSKEQKEKAIHKNFFIKFYDKIFFDKVNNIKLLHNSIFSSIGKNINILYLFLEDSNLFSKKYPVEYFLNENIDEINKSWLLSNINYNTINFSSNIINDELLKLLSQNIERIKTNNFKSITINKTVQNKTNTNKYGINNNDEAKKEEEYFLYKTRVYENLINKVQNLKFINLISNEFNTVINDCHKKYISDNNNNINENGKNKINLDMVEKMHFVNCKFNDNDDDIFEDILDVLDKRSVIKMNASKLKKLKIKKCQISSFNSIFTLIENCKSLKMVILENINITQKSFIHIIIRIKENINIINSLEYLSFSKNEISKVDFKDLKFRNNFNSLKYINFSKNNIYSFSEKNFDFLPMIKSVDLSYNNITSKKLFKYIIKNKKDILVVFSSNLFLNNSKNKQGYLRYLLSHLTNPTSEACKKLNLSLLFDNDNLINGINFNSTTKLSLIKLDLSYNCIKTDSLKQLFKNNRGLIGLKKLTLSHNLIDFSFFVEEENDIYLPNLNIIDLSFNNVKYTQYSDIDIINNFVKSKPNLKDIMIQKNSFFYELVIDLDHDRDNIYSRLEILGIKIKLIVEEELYDYTDNKLNQIFIFKNSHIKT